MRRDYMRPVLVFLSGMLFAAVCGCAVGKPVALTDETRLLEARELRPDGLGYSVAVAPVHVEQSGTAGSRERWPLTLDAAALQEEIASALGNIPVFRGVSQTPFPDPDAARESGKQLLLNVTLSDCMSSFGGTNSFFIPNLFVWGILSPIAAAFVADESYTVTGRIEVKLTETKDGGEIWSRVISLQEKYDLNDWQRGPSVWDYTLIAPFYNSWTPRKVDAVVIPHVTRRIIVELAASILEDVPPPVRNLAVVVGLDSCGLFDAPVLDCARKDAQDFAKALSESGFDEVALLTGSDARRDALETHLKRTAERSDVAVENFVLYFAGLGTTRFDPEESTCSQSLLMYGDDPEESQLPLAGLLELVEVIPAVSKAIVIDAGFISGDGRTYNPEPLPADAQLAYPDAVRSNATMTLLMACSADQSAYESELLGNGVFTHYLLRGFSGDADLNGDGTITIQEAFKDAGWPVSRFVRGSLQGKSQKPCVLGKDPALTSLLKVTSKR